MIKRTKERITSKIIVEKHQLWYIWYKLKDFFVGIYKKVCWW